MFKLNREGKDLTLNFRPVSTVFGSSIKKKVPD